MIKIHMTMQSITLYRPVPVTIALPYSPLAGAGSYKTLWVLHPAMEDGNFFFDKLSVASLVDKHNLAIIAPSLGNGYFMDSCLEEQADFLDSELRPYLQTCFPLSSCGKDNFLLGISMGAFGVVRWGLSSPDAFAAVAAISGVYDPRLPIDERALKDRLLRSLVKLFGERVMNRLMKDARGEILAGADIHKLLAAHSPVSFPRLALFCGNKDYCSLNQTEALVTLCKEHGLDVTVMYGSGTHDIAYWLPTVHKAVEWLLSYEG